MQLFQYDKNALLSDDFKQFLVIMMNGYPYSKNKDFYKLVKPFEDINVKVIPVVFGPDIGFDPLSKMASNTDNLIEHKDKNTSNKTGELVIDKVIKGKIL